MEKKKYVIRFYPKTEDFDFFPVLTNEGVAVRKVDLPKFRKESVEVCVFGDTPDEAWALGLTILEKFLREQADKILKELNAPDGGVTDEGCGDYE